MLASMREWLPGDRPPYFISDMVDHLDLSSIIEHYVGGERGYSPYHPSIVVKEILYAYCTSVVFTEE